MTTQVQSITATVTIKRGRRPVKTLTAAAAEQLTRPELTAKNIGDADKIRRRLEAVGLLGKEVNLDRRGRHMVLSPLDIKPLESQRDASLEWAFKCLKGRGGWDWGAAGVLNVVRVNGEYYAWDGNGRLLQAQITGIPKIDCWVFDGTMEQGAEHFVYNQKDGLRTLTNEQIFVNEVFSGNSEALETCKQLKVVGLAIEGAKDIRYPEGSSDPLVKYNAFVKTLRITDSNLKVMKLARDIIHEAYPKDGIVRAELFGGLSFLLHKWGEKVWLGEEYEKFKEFMIVFMGLKPQHKLPFKKDGGNVHNDEHGSVARGIRKHFFESLTPYWRKKYPQVDLNKKVAEEDEEE